MAAERAGGMSELAKKGWSADSVKTDGAVVARGFPAQQRAEQPTAMALIALFMRTSMLRGALAFVSLLVLATASFAQTRIRGVVLDSDRMPVADAVIAFEAQFEFDAAAFGTSARTPQTATNQNGEFLFIGLTRGAYMVVARKADASDALTIAVAETPELMARVVEMVLRREPAPAGSQTGASIAGRVADTSGQALPGVAITAVDTTGVILRTMSGSDGRYRLDVTPKRTYRVDFDLRHFDLFRSHNAVALAESTMRIDATLRVSGTCECVTVVTPAFMERGGQVLDDAGRPLAYARLELVSGNTLGLRTVALADAEGRFLVRLPSDAAWSLEASDSGFQSVSQRVSGAEAELIVFTLPRLVAPAAPHGERFRRGCRCPGHYFVYSEQ